jgi:hypothetical protein
VSWLHELSVEFAAACPAADKDEADLLVACLWGLSTYFNVVKTSGRFFTDDQVALLDRGGHAFLFAYSALAAKQANPTLWHHVPKHHHFHHLVLDSAVDRMNPRYFTCFSDEDLIGQTLRVARRSHASTVVEHTVSFWILGAKQRFEG